MAMTDDGDGVRRAGEFFRTLECRWATINLVLRTLIRQTALRTRDPERFAADVFNDASTLVDITSDEGADPIVGAEIHQLIDAIAGLVADDLQVYRRATTTQLRRRRPSS
jgi:hypothetical protein